MDNIKYISTCRGFTKQFFNTPALARNQYCITFNDGSEIELFLNHQMMFSKGDMKNGKQRNEFIKKYTIKEAAKLVEQLEKTIGYIDSDDGEIILVDNSNVKYKVTVK